MCFFSRFLMVRLVSFGSQLPTRLSMPSCSQPSRTLRAADAVARRRAILDRRCARRHGPLAGRDGRMAPIEQKDWTRRRSSLILSAFSILVSLTASQQQNPGMRASRRAEKIRGQLRGNSAEPFRVKPRGMHWRTYRRLCEEAGQAEAAAESWFSESIGQALDRLKETVP